ncbi:hypothetical protein C922_03123 [Plasmodium inui San Antonio 1]|uniref:Uncharacterized protein n=1 Tax=Plasmodium inui San Antonio 1 TaxID=1237626 RepID=W7ABL5_9APIC|nr:hypothetical protein C922_03123 [Plasmodium inui San Antonio 1]EUD66489.1 hypothetical protein C922_03123 [Plasmodium inui San Antonio 1]
MQNIIDTYEIIGKIDDQRSISSNSLLSHEESHEGSLAAGGNDSNLDSTERKGLRNNADGEEAEQGSKENRCKGYKGGCPKGDTSKSKSSTMENMKGEFEGETSTGNLNGGSQSNLMRIDSGVEKAAPGEEAAIHGEPATTKVSPSESKTNDKIEDTLNGGTTHGGDSPTADNPNRNSNQERTSQIDNCKNSCKKHYKVLIHAPACWKGEKFNSTPFIFVYDKSSNFFTYSESPLEIEKYIIDTSAENFQSRVLTIIFYDSVFACTTSSLLLNNNKGEIHHLPKPLSVFYLPLSKLDLCNDSVKYRLALRTNSILCDVNIKEAISLFNNNSKIAGPNVNKFSLHLILKNRNYHDNEMYSYLNYQTKFYGLPRSNLSSCVPKYTGVSTDRAKMDRPSRNVPNRYVTKSSKSQVHIFTKHQTDPNHFISLERLKNKWENYNQVNNEKRTQNHSAYNPLKKKDTKLTSYGIPNDNESFVSRGKSEVDRQEASMGGEQPPINDTRKYGEANNEKGTPVKRNLNKKDTYNMSEEINSYNYGKTKSIYDLMHVSKDKLSVDFDAKDDVFPEDSASMINIFEKESALSERGKQGVEGGSTLTSNIRAAKDMYSRVKSAMRKRGDARGQSGDQYGDRLAAKPEERNRDDDLECITKSQVDRFGEDKSACYSQLENLRCFNANNSVCSSYGRNDENVILAMKEIKQWMEKIEDKMSTISCDKSDLNAVSGHSQSTDKRYNRIIAFLIKSIKNNIRLKNKCIYRSCYLNIRNLYLLKKNEKVKFENKLMMRNYGQLKSKYKNVLVNLCKKNLLIKYYSIKDKFQYSKKYENMMRHLQQEKNDLLSIIEEKKYEQENSHNINLMLSEELKKAQEDKESILSKNFFYKSETNKAATKCEMLQREVDRLKEELQCAKRESEKEKTGTGQIKLETEQLKMEKEELKMEKEELKMQTEQLKMQTEQLKMEKDALIKELGETKAKYFNLTGILEGEEKMYSQKVQELEKKIENLTEEKNTLINEIKGEIDHLTKMLSDKEMENTQMKEKLKEKLKELKNVEEKCKDTQINFDSLKKEFEKSFDEVQIILKEMIHKEKEYTKKYNNSIKCLETEHRKTVEKLLNEKEQFVTEANYYKDVCHSQCSKITSFDESLTAAEKLLDHVLSQYPQVFNDFKVSSRNNVLNKSFGKMHYENIQSVRDNIKLIRKSLSQFKMSFKNSSFNFQMGSDYSRKYSLQKKGSFSPITGNKRMNSILRYYGSYHRYGNQAEHPYVEDEPFCEEQSSRRRSISNNSARNMSIISNTRKTINLKNQVDSYNSQMQRNVSQSRCRSGSVSGKQKVSTLYGDLKKRPSSRKASHDEEAPNGGPEDGRLDDQLAERDSSRYTKSKSEQLRQEAAKGSHLAPGDSYEAAMEWHVEGSNGVSGMGGVGGIDGTSFPNEIDELNHIDIVNMYEANDYFNDGGATNGSPQGASNTPSSTPSNPPGINAEGDFSNTHPDIEEAKRKNSEKENYEFDKDNFKEIISFIEKNVMKNSDTVNTSGKDRKNVEDSKGAPGKASLGENNGSGGQAMCENQEQPVGHAKAEEKDSSPRRAQTGQRNIYQSSPSRKTGTFKYTDKVSKHVPDNNVARSVSNNSKATSGRGIIGSNKGGHLTGLPTGQQSSRTKNSSNTTSVTKAVVSSCRKNSSLIYRKGTESGTVGNNREDEVKRHISTNYKYRATDDSDKQLKKNKWDFLKYAKGSIVKKSVTPDRERNTSTNANKSALSRT